MDKVITLQLTVTDEQHEQLVQRFISQASAVVESSPANTVPANTAPDEAPALDERGVPWNPEVHAATKTMTKAGAWKKRKGVDEKQHAEYEQPYLQAASQTPPQPSADQANISTQPENRQDPANVQVDENGHPIMPEFLKRDNPNAATPGATGQMPSMPQATPPSMPGMPQADPQPITMENCVGALENLAMKFKQTGLDHDAAFSKAYDMTLQFYAQVGTDANQLETNETHRRQVYELLTNAVESM